MPSSNEKVKREKRIRRNMVAKELANRLWRQRRIDKNYKKKKKKELEESYDTYID